METNKTSKHKSVTFNVKLIFHLLFLLSIAAVFKFGYNKSLSSIFRASFLFSDIFEIILVSIVSYTYYYCIFITRKLLNIKVIWLLILVFGLFLTALAKTFYSPYFNTIAVLEITSKYIGFGAMIFFLLWVLDNYNLIINNKFIATKRALNEAESKLLRRQFNPHFLFNAFNSLYSLSLQNHPKTPDTILKLSGMMRYLTDDASVSKVKLSRELKFIEDYIAIEKIRFGDNAKINFEISGSINDLTIEPLLLITLVENAFKHGFYTNDINSFITINAIIKDEDLLFKVENSIQDQQHFNKTVREGKGLDNLKKRLQLSYPKTSKYVFENKSNVYLAQLEIKLN